MNKNKFDLIDKHIDEKSIELLGKLNTIPTWIINLNIIIIFILLLFSILIYFIYFI